jgi:predicted amidohydrolase
MKLANLTFAAAQTGSVRGDISANIAVHARFAREASRFQVELLVFPELSLTGYEPELAEQLAVSSNASCLQPLRDISRQTRITLVAGAPILLGSEGPYIGAVAFHPDGGTSVYTKQHLHPGEEKHFLPGSGGDALHINNSRIALAICADTSHAEHAQQAARLGAELYAAGVLVSEKGYNTDIETLQGYARKHAMAVLMANHAAPAGRWIPAGGSAIWSETGQCIAAVTGRQESLVVATYRDGQWDGQAVPL